MTKVPHLKGSTHREQARWMHSRMAWNDNLKQAQSDTLTEGTRHWMIEEIKRLSPDDFPGWYDKVYKLRSENKQAEYEKAIREKYALLTEALKHTPFDYTAALECDQPDPTDAAECAAIQEWLGENWGDIPPVEF